ncbi:putative electron-transferring-flavoprotein [Candidatus Zinderia insecticola CARI]|uniref:Electron transfer flavoprotein-ubiquinone oxidoreductase n=1 Tax=Zinderia insecticola (strain CARI) TaxID=871271 RepID=E0TIY4_ZINIC|nr:putative electron-transferring-flavoprotein [Candidatus Zinderia insecticola CARI]
MINKKKYLYENINYDIIIIGAGPSGISCAIKLKQLSIFFNLKLSICVIEKSKFISSNIISGAIFNTKYLKELLPNWKFKNLLFKNKVKLDLIYYLTRLNYYKIPNIIIPKNLKNKNKYIISLSKFIIWLSKEAKKLNIEIFESIAAKKIVYKNNKVIYIKTNEFNINKYKIPNKNFFCGIKIYFNNLILAEGAKGFLTEKIILKYNLNKNKNSQNYSLGIKELWKIKNKNYNKGLILHTFGWPLNKKIYSGGFLYNMENNIISVGYIISLSYKNPYISPYDEFQKFKLHPLINKFLENGKCISYGARVINLGDLNSIPKLNFNNIIIIGCSAGFLNSSSLKGIHTSIKSGIIAAEYIIYKKINKKKKINNIFKKTWLYKELYNAKNHKIFMIKGFYLGILLLIINKIFYNKKNNLKYKKYDYKMINLSNFENKIKYKKYNNINTFSKSSSLIFSNLKYNDNQPSHLKFKNKKYLNINYNLYNKIEERYCPANVYEYINKNLQINFQNCLHCKTCSIKDPKQNIKWTPCEGGNGPNYLNM